MGVLHTKAHSRLFIQRLVFRGQASVVECLDVLRDKRSKTMMTDGQFDTEETHTTKLDAVIGHFLDAGAIEPIQLTDIQDRALKHFTSGDLDDAVYKSPDLNEAFNQIVFRFTEYGRNLYYAKRLRHLSGVEI